MSNLQYRIDNSIITLAISQFLTNDDQPALSVGSFQTLIHKINPKGLIVSFVPLPGLTDWQRYNNHNTPDDAPARMNISALAQFLDSQKIPVIGLFDDTCKSQPVDLILSVDIRCCTPDTIFVLMEESKNASHNQDISKKIKKLLPAKYRDTWSQKQAINASQAQQIGFVTMIAERENLQDAGLTILNSMVKNRSIEVVGRIMSAIKQYKTSSLDTALNEEGRQFCILSHKEYLENQDNQHNNYENRKR